MNIIAKDHAIVVVGENNVVTNNNIHSGVVSNYLLEAISHQQEIIINLRLEVIGLKKKVAEIEKMLSANKE